LNGGQRHGDFALSRICSFGFQTVKARVLDAEYETTSHGGDEPGRRFHCHDGIGAR